MTPEDFAIVVIFFIISLTFSVTAIAIASAVSNTISRLESEVNSLRGELARFKKQFSRTLF